MPGTINGDLMSVHATKGDVIQMSSRSWIMIQCVINALIRKGLITAEEIDSETELATQITHDVLVQIEAQADAAWREANPEMAATWDQVRTANIARKGAT